MLAARQRDPAIYAPDGWPLKIGDRVTDEDRDRLVAGCRLRRPGHGQREWWGGDPLPDPVRAERQCGCLQ